MLTYLMRIFIPFQWTVNGQLRVGFFTTKAVTAGTELTFDYQFQRYGYCFSAVHFFATLVFYAVCCDEDICVQKEWLFNLLTV